MKNEFIIAGLGFGTVAPRLEAIADDQGWLKEEALGTTQLAERR